MPSPYQWGLGAAAAAIAAVAAWLPSYYTGLLIECLIFSIFALGLNILVGYAGLPSLGHAAFFAAGAYAAGLVSIFASSNLFVGVLAGIAAGWGLSALFGIVALRASGVYFLMITLALAQIAWAAAITFRGITGGDDGLRGIVRATVGIPGIDPSTTSTFYLLTLLAFVAALVLTRIILRSPFGRSLLGIQEREARMAALGYNVWLHKYIAFMVSGGFAGFAGALFVQYQGFVSPAAAGVVISAEVMLMIILGGVSTLAGPVIGAFGVILLSNLISAYTAHWTFVLGGLYVFSVIVAPAGIVGELRKAMRPNPRDGPS